MNRSVRRIPLSLRRLALVLAAAGLSACDGGPTGPDPSHAREVGVVLNSIDVTLTLFPVDSPDDVRTVVLAPDGSPVGFAARGDLAVVPMGFLPALAVVDLKEGVVARSVALPTNSGATGAAFLDDSIVLVANPGLNSVSRVNVRSGSVAPPIPVGTYPQGIVVSGARVGVINANLGPDFLPQGPGTVTVLDRSSLEVLGTVPLSGHNPGDAAVAEDGTVYVVSSGRFGAGDGSLSLVDLQARVELAHHEGFGEFPFAAALGPDGRLHVGSFGYGVAVWDPATASFVRAPSQAVTPEGIPSVSGLAFDADGRLWTLRPDCSAPSVANRLDGSWAVEAQVPVGTCPIDLAFSSLEE